MSIRSDVVSQFNQVAKEQNKILVHYDDDVPLTDSGLDSLCLAIIVARLEDLVGIDPFSVAAAEEKPFPVTVGEFIRFYENAAK